MTTPHIGIIGSAGRMGQAIATEMAAAGLASGGGVDRDGDITTLANVSNILIDFSSPAALEANLDAGVAAGTAMLIGTTGLDIRHHWLIDRAAETIPILQTGNTSLGVNMLAALVEAAARRLGPEWDIEIIETHHRMKVDAPSGTALLLGEAAARGRGVDLPQAAIHGRTGITGARPTDGIGFAAVRGGSVAGDHSVCFLGDHERLTLSHMAENRTIFARGAIKAALWLVGQPAGRYRMADVLGSVLESVLPA